jgi:hypothetical protein
MARPTPADGGVAVIDWRSKTVVPSPAKEAIAIGAAEPRIVAVQAIEHILSRPAVENVVAEPSGQVIVIAVASQGIVIRRPRDRLERVTFGNLRGA